MHIMDEVNNVFKTTFKGVCRSVLPAVETWLTLKNAQVIGCDISDIRSETDTLTAQVYARYVRPGKHSIFVYDPERDQLFMKIVVVEELRSWEIEERDVQPIEVSDRSTIHKKEQRSMLLSQAFLEDIQPSVWDLSRFLRDKKDVESALKAIDVHYEGLVSLFYEMYSESQDTYPLISLACLKDFCKRGNLLPEDQLNFELPAEEGEEQRSSKTKSESKSRSGEPR